MDHELNTVTPARQMSGRRSKPSMDLLIDNQRVLSQYIVPQKKSRLKIPKRQLDERSISNASELSSSSSKEKRVTKPYRRKIIIKSSEENISPKIVKKKRKIMSPVVNGSNDSNENKISTTDNHLIISRSPYTTLKIKKIDNNDNIKSKKEDIDIIKEDDDLPLCKVFPDFKPNVTVSTEVTVPEKRATLVLPPKKKIKCISINELNGFQVFPKPVVAIMESKSDILALPKIPKKSHSNNNGIKSSPVTLAPPPSVSEEHTNDSNHVLENNVPGPDLVEPEQVTESPPPAEESPPMVTPRRCVREQCTNVAIDDIRWEREFCSPDCAVMHTKNVFVEWLQQKQGESDAISV